MVTPSLVRLLLLALSVAPRLGASQAPPPAADSTIRRLLEERIAAGRTAGIVVGVVDRRGRHVVSAGSGGPGGPPAVDGTTLFEIGSITKVFTGILLADLVQNGIVRLDQPVGELLPGWRIPARGDRPITLAHLATHRSGLPRLPSNLAPRDVRNPYADYDGERLRDFLASHELRRAPGELYEYSNLGAGLLGHALATYAGMSYESLLNARVLKPLRMGDTRIVIPPALQSRLARGHDADGEPAANWNLDALAGAGALRSTVNDMLDFLAANLGADSASPIGATLIAARTPYARGGANEPPMALGWHILRARGREIVWHNGGTGGYASWIGFDAAAGRGVVVLANTATPSDDLALHILDPRFPLAPSRTAIVLDPTRLDQYAGRYELAPTFVIAITRDGDDLYAQATDQPRFRIYPEREDSFFLRVVEAQLVFERDADGRIIRLVLEQNGQRTPGRRLP